jgi:cysteine desulfurase family protein (TIGR01976 family)
MAGMSAIDLAWVRTQFPALVRMHAGEPVVYFDGPAGSQVPRRTIEAVAGYLADHNANTHGEFATSRETDGILADARQAGADLVGAEDPREIVFGPNATSLLFALSRSLARTWRRGERIVVTELDHDANVTPWVLAARDAGVEVVTVPIRRDTTIDMERLEAAVTPGTRLLAMTAASNATGTRTPIGRAAAIAHAAGAELAIDAVHYAPHDRIDVEAWGCDFLVASAYKFFGPHVGLLWGRRARLAALEPYKVRPASDEMPDRWMTGTANHEGIAGTAAAIEYLADLGRSAGGPASRRAALDAAYRAIVAHEAELCRRLLAGLARLPSVTVWGIADPARLAERVPTVSITHARSRPQAVAAYLAERGVFVWHGNYYALELSRALGREPDGMVRIGCLHYNTAGEVDRLLALLEDLEA